MTADLPWDQRKSQREREMVNQWCINPAQLLSFLTQWPWQRFRRGSSLCFWLNVSPGKRLIALDYQLTIVGSILLCWIFSSTTQLQKKYRTWKSMKDCFRMSLKLVCFFIPGREFFVGLSRRTNQRGAEILADTFKVCRFLHATGNTSCHSLS